MKRRKKKGQGLKHSRTEVMGERECGGENNAWLWSHPREATVCPGKKGDEVVAPKSPCSSSRFSLLRRRIVPQGSELFFPQSFPYELCWPVSSPLQTQSCFYVDTQVVHTAAHYCLMERFVN